MFVLYMNIVIMLISFIIIILFIINNNNEYLESEAVRNMATVYNAGKITTTSLAVTGNATAATLEIGTANVSGNTTSKDLTVSGNTNINGGFKFKPVCRMKGNPGVDMGAQNRIEYLNRIASGNKISCNEDEYMNGWDFVNDGAFATINVKCCKIGV